METISIILLFLLAVVVSRFVARLFPAFLPLPIVQIGIGALVAYESGLGVTLNPEIFFLLFLPPLLFLDGWRIPKRGFFRDSGTILALAVGLVIFTVLGVGFFVHWLIPAMPLPVAFALAAVLSPTDPVAVSAVAAKVPIPDRLMHILEGESLLNDASGLVCLRFAVAAAMTGVFALPSALWVFLELVSVGIVVGVAVALAASVVQDRVTHWSGEDSGTRTLLSVLIPFGAFLAAERLHGSGILAAVSAGIAMNYVEIFSQTPAVTRMAGKAVWSTVQLVGNGAMFVLLGEQLPKLLSRATQIVEEAAHRDPWWLLLYVVAITGGLALLRFLWVGVSLNLVLFRRSLHGEVQTRCRWRLLAATSLAGVKGAVTLAGILTLPLMLPDGSAFPTRGLAIFLAMGVILLSLIAANLGLPRLLRGLDLPAQPSLASEEDSARVAIDRAAAQAIQQAQHEFAEGSQSNDPDSASLYAEAAERALEPYQRRHDSRRLDDEEGKRDQQLVGAERQFRITGLRAARAELYRLRRADRIEDRTLRRMVREIDLSRCDTPRRRHRFRVSTGDGPSLSGPCIHPEIPRKLGPGRIRGWTYQATGRRSGAS